MYRIFESLLTLLLVFATTSGAVNVSTDAQTWQRYVRSPTSRTVLPIGIISSLTQGTVTNPSGLLAPGGDVTTLTRAGSASNPPLWPSGTTVTASSYHAAGNGRTYTPQNAIDNNTSTFWNDNTQGAYPDVLTITARSAISMAGVTIVSNSDGVPTNLTVDVLINNIWYRASTVTGNTAVQFQAPFPRTVSTTSVRITVTKDPTTYGEFTRIAEVYPSLVAVTTASTVPAVVVDFGKVVGGYLSIKFAGASSNVPGIRLAFSETLQYLSDLSDFSRSNNGQSITPGSDQIAVQSAPYTWTDAYGCQSPGPPGKVCADGYHGFRYVKIYLDALSADSPLTTNYGNVTIDSVSLNFSPFLGTQDTFAGWFDCSDSALAQYWYDGVYTTDLCTDGFDMNSTEPRSAYSASLNSKQVVFDGAKRDRDPYSGDIAVSGKTIYMSHFNNSLAAANVLADLADHQRSDGWIPPASINSYTLSLFDYPLWWIFDSYDYIMHTGDSGYARKYYPNLVSVLDNYYAKNIDSATGLLNKGAYDSSGYGDYGFLNRQGIITYYNALYVLCLKQAARWSQTYGTASDGTRWLTLASSVTTAINNNMWDANAGAYVDVKGSTTHAQDGNSIAILAGVAPAARATSLLSYWETLALNYGNPFYSDGQEDSSYPTRVYAFISYFEIAARFITSGKPNTAIEEIKRLYGWMATHDPQITHWEGIGPNGSPYEGGFSSQAHAWGTGVTSLLSNYLLGIQPTGFGYSTWSIKPIPAGGVTYARGQAGTPSGTLSAAWQNDASAYSFYLDFAGPAGTNGVVSVPVTSQTAVVAVDYAVVYRGNGGGNVGGNTTTGANSYNVTYSSDGYVNLNFAGGARHVVTVAR